MKTNTTYIQVRLHLPDERRKSGKIRLFAVLLVAVVLGAIGLVAPPIYYTAKNITNLLGENIELKENISQLTEESQIGYAKVIKQEKRDGKLYTRLLFVETERNDPRKLVLKKEFEIEGDVVHFDALIVKFKTPLVMEGQERAMYLWRRVYGETMTPETGYAIEEPGSEPMRYRDISRSLSLDDKKLFWGEIWNLANDPQALSDAGIQAIYGNVIYRSLRPGLIYVFKINNTGNLYPEVVPDL
jgi:hypothetical protein